MRTNTIPVSDLEVIIQDALKGSVDDIAKRYGVIPATVLAFLRKHHKSITEMLHEQTQSNIDTCLAQGMSKQAIRLKLGLSRRDVRTKFPSIYEDSHIPVDKLEEIVKLLETNQLNVVADQFNVDRSSMSKFLTRHGYKYKEIVANYRTKVIKESLAQGLKKKEIAEILRITPNQIYQAFKNDIYVYAK